MKEWQGILPGLEIPPEPRAQGEDGHWRMIGNNRCFEPGDVLFANKKFRASCGPCAFAAIAGRQVAEVMPFFGPKFYGWCNARMMEAALNATGAPFIKKGKVWPSRGLTWLQIEGPWCDDPTDFVTPCKHSHWIAVVNELVYDWNAGVWLDRMVWQREIINEIIRQDEGATGFAPRAAFHVFERRQG